MIHIQTKKPILLLILSLCELAAGAIFLVFQDRLIDVFHYVAATIFFLYGIMFFLSSFKKESEPYGAAIGIILFSLGFLSVFSPNSPDLICVLWGVFGIVKAAFGIDRCLKTRTTSARFFIHLTFDLAELPLSLLLLLHLKNALGHHVLFLGISFLVYGTEYLFLCVSRFRQERRIRKNQE